jgi:ribonuclease III family protein
MMFVNIRTDPDNISLRLLAGLGDAVNSLIERERAIIHTHSAKQMHNWTKERVNATAQAANLERLMQFLNEKEQSIVRRASNLKTANYSKTGQLLARQATAYETLLGYLYISNFARLQELIGLLDGPVI